MQECRPSHTRNVHVGQSQCLQSSSGGRLWRHHRALYTSHHPVVVCSSGRLWSLKNSLPAQVGLKKRDQFPPIPAFIITDALQTNDATVKMHYLILPFHTNLPSFKASSPRWAK